MDFLQDNAAVSLGLFLGMLLCTEIGRRIGARRAGPRDDAAHAGLGAIEGAIFALMGLLVAFTFSGAASRLDARRQLIAEEANAIGTAWLRLDLLPADAQPALRDGFRRYVDARIAIYEAIPDLAGTRAAFERANALQLEIWRQAVAAVPHATIAQAPSLVLPPLNEMIDITSTRLMAMQIHPPGVVYVMLVGVALAAALFSGYAMAGARRPSWLHRAGFAFIVSLSVFVILDLEYPRKGLIRIDAADQMLVELRASMD